MANLVVEVYKRTGARTQLRSVLAKNLDEVGSFLKTIFKNEIYIEPIINDLAEQRKNPKAFPNVVVFLDENGEPVGIDGFMGAMFAIQLINIKGGSRTVMGKTLAECKDLARKISEATLARDPKSFVASTIPYAVYKSFYDNNGLKLKLYDATVPFEIKKGLGIELRLLLSDSEL